MGEGAYPPRYPKLRTFRTIFSALWALKQQCSDTMPSTIVIVTASHEKQVCECATCQCFVWIWGTAWGCAVSHCLCVCVCQARAVEQELKARQEVGGIWADVTFFAVPDPSSARVGSGGATFNALLTVVRRAGWCSHPDG